MDTNIVLILEKVNGETVDTNIKEFTSNETKPSFTGSTDKDSLVSFEIRSNPVYGSVKADYLGNWNWSTISDLPAGRHRVTINSEDLAGNTTSVAFNLIVPEIEEETESEPADETADEPATEDI